MRRFLMAAAAAALALGLSAHADAAAPDVLSDADAALYAEIFALQDDARWTDADERIAQLSDPVLMGYVRYQRYMHPTGYRASFTELKEWMAFYADLPVASDVHALALKRRPKSAAPPVRPTPRKWRPAKTSALHPDLEADYARTSRPKLTQIEGRVRHLAKANEATTALKEIERHKAQGTITERQFDRMRSWIAASLYYQGYVDRAREIAEEVAARNGDSAVLAYWIAGLIAFREGDMTRAHERFGAMARVETQEDDLRAGAGFWAARAGLAAGRLDTVTADLEIAAAYPFTFYGQLALAQLGRDYAYDWSAPMVTEDGFARIAERYPAVRRAVALAEAGEDIEADLELRWINGAIEDHEDYDLLAVAAALDLPAAQIDIALNGDAKYLESGLFPIPRYAPEGGFRTDRALLYALMRQESKFKVEATSRVGARGLMQLMPRTASYMAKDRSLAKGKGRNRLYDPAVNLEIGQTYVNHLIDTTAGGDLFDMAVAYNGGPGNLRKWKREVAIEDPLLFIESIPNPESRDFVERVLTNVWVYRARLGQPAPSRDRVAAGELPLYEALDDMARRAESGE